MSADHPDKISHDESLWVSSALSSFYIDHSRSEIEKMLIQKRWLKKDGLPSSKLPGGFVQIEQEEDLNLTHVSFKKEWLFHQFKRWGWGDVVGEEEFEFRLKVWRLGIILLGFQEEREYVIDLSVQTHRYPQGGYREGIIEYLDQAFEGRLHGLQAIKIMDRLKRFPLSQDTLKLVQSFMPTHVADQANLEDQTTKVEHQKPLYRL